MSAVLGRQWYHGTAAELQPGDEVKPSAETGRSTFPYDPYDWRAKRVFVTQQPRNASFWSRIAAQGEPGHVYEVEHSDDHPMPDVGRDSFLPRDVGADRFHVSRARVVRRVDPREWR